MRFYIEGLRKDRGPFLIQRVLLSDANQRRRSSCRCLIIVGNRLDEAESSGRPASYKTNRDTVFYKTGYSPYKAVILHNSVKHLGKAHCAYEKSQANIRKKSYNRRFCKTEVCFKWKLWNSVRVIGADHIHYAGCLRLAWLLCCLWQQSKSRRSKSNNRFLQM